MSGTTCPICGAYMGPDRGHGGSPRRYCSGRCRTAACRRRKAIPKTLTDLPRWTRCDGKRPIQPDGRPASSTDPTTWSRFEDVQDGAGDGYGIMLGDGLACYDLDHILDGRTIRPRHPGRLIVDKLEREGSIYAEISVSGEGLHYLIHSDAPSWRHGNVEFYSHGRFIRITGRTWNPSHP